MSSMGIAIAATGLSLVLIFVWMISLSMRKQRLEVERQAREAAYRKAMKKLVSKSLKSGNLRLKPGTYRRFYFWRKKRKETISSRLCIGTIKRRS